MGENSELLYTTEQLIKDIETVSEITNRFINIIWCEQNSNFNFDKLSKAEQIQLIGLHKDAAMLENSLKMYKSWYRK
jgi:hypothetical protein